MNLKKRPFKKIDKSFSALFIIALCLILLPETNFAFISNSPAVTSKINKADGDFDKKFREGRDLIDKEDWAKAAERFNEIVDKYPADKSADAALYWLAFCYKKQKQFKETDQALERLLKDFPASSWTDDARVMKLEIAVPLGKMLVGNVSALNSAAALPSGVYSAPNIGNGAPASLAATTAPATFEKFKTLNDIYIAAAPQTPLDRADEIKLAAFQSLFSADEKKGIEVMSEVLESDSKASENLKLAILRAVRRPRTVSNYTYSVSGTTPPQTVNSTGNQTTALLRESLVKSFQNETNVKIRKEIIYTLANLKDEQSINYLVRLYSSEENREVKKAIINGFGSFSGNYGFYANAIGLTQNSALPSASNTQTQAVEFAKLLEILRIEKDAELRNLALTSLQRFVGWEKNGQIVETLIGLYDSSTDEDFKKSIVNNLAKMKQPQASKKLLDIAKNDKSDKLKLEAIYALRNTNTPEALKYLEELIK